MTSPSNELPMTETDDVQVCSPGSAPVHHATVHLARQRDTHAVHKNFTRTQVWVGLDIGSTTVKVAVIDPQSHALIHHAYRRHGANQADTAFTLMTELSEYIPDRDVHLAICGSGAEPMCRVLECCYVQEVIAAGLSATTFYPHVNSILELGGQDAKLLLLSRYSESQPPVVNDMRMNGVCAGGTGAFLDQMAQLLNVNIEKFSEIAAAGTTIFPVSGRCGVFAKTDVQRLLASGARREDIALSVYHAVVAQTVSGLAQGTTIEGPLLMLGGPLAFNAPLRAAFMEKLGLSNDKIVVPEHAELVVAAGAALYAGQTEQQKNGPFAFGNLARIRHSNTAFFTDAASFEAQRKFFTDEAEQKAFLKRHEPPIYHRVKLTAGDAVEGYLGIDAGSTTVKFVLIGNDEKVLYRHYQSGGGDPLFTLINGLKELYRYFTEREAKLVIKGLGTTGYGEHLMARALGADYHTVETVAHAAAAVSCVPEATFVLDVGGQDMKAIRIEKGVVTDIYLNEACSAGCGSFVETFARSLGIAVEDIASSAFKSNDNSMLGSRCTVFMNSLVTTEQRAGRSANDIIAGICRSIVENIFTKVIRPSDAARMRDHVVVQGGTFRNDAVLASLEQYLGKEVYRAPYPGEMGALGVALLTKKKVDGAGKRSSFIGFETLGKFKAEYLPPDNCPFCSNSCSRTIIRFHDGSTFVTGNRCERGEVVSSAAGEAKAAAPKKPGGQIDLLKLRSELVFGSEAPRKGQSRGRIGIPRVLEFYYSFPFWQTFFVDLGFEVILSPANNRRQYESGLHQIPSDTVCFPAKLVHGHIESLCARGVDRIFLPMMLEIEKRPGHGDARYMCPVVEGYPMVTRLMNTSCAHEEIPIDTPVFRFNTDKNRFRQIREYCQLTFDIGDNEVRAAYRKAITAQTRAFTELRNAAKQVITQTAERGGFAVVVAGRPYQYDPFVNHHLSSHFVKRGIPVIPLDALEGLDEIDLSSVRPDIYNPFHAMVLAGAIRTAESPNLQMAQIVSFGCGHDAILTDETSRILRSRGDKSLLVLKLDESSADGPVRIRIDSFIETVGGTAERTRNQGAQHEEAAFPGSFTKQDKAARTILIPNLSEAFTQIVSAAFKTEGYSVKTLPFADDRAVELGKRYLHNDICFPAQITVGECLRELIDGDSDPSKVAVGVAKNCLDCRAGQYSVLARKALDDAGFPGVPLISTGKDTKGMHPGFRLSPLFNIRMIWGLAAADRLMDMLLRTRPYEQEQGAAEKIYSEMLQEIALAAGATRFSRISQLLEEAAERFNGLPLITMRRKPRIFVIGEILLNYHPSANYHLVDFLETKGIEVVMPHMVPFFQKEFIKTKDGAKRSFLMNPISEMLTATLSDALVKKVFSTTGKAASKFKYAEPVHEANHLAKSVSEMVDPSLIVGEGWLIPAEIIENVNRGISAAIVIQPFGCLPNQITGKGLFKTLRSWFPSLQLLSIDYDPDTSLANIESRLHMMIMAIKQRDKGI